jgi:hypothetical protein
MSEPAGEHDAGASIELLRSYLAGRDVACPGCQYNLRDLRGGPCPECGERIALRVGLVEPRQRLLIAGLVFISAGAGLSGLLLVYAAIQAIIRRGGDLDKFIAINVVSLAIESAAMVVWLRSWTRIRRQKLSTRSVLVMLCAGLTLLDIVFFSLELK